MKRVANAVFILLFLAGLAVISIGTLCAPKKSDSYWENRRLAGFPLPLSECVLDGTFFSEVENYVSDHVIWRDGLMKLSTWADFKLGRPVVSNRVVSSTVMLNFLGYEQSDLTEQKILADDMGKRLSGINELITSYGGYFCYVGVPSQHSYFNRYYPAYMDNQQRMLQSVRHLFAEILAEYSIPYIDMLSVYDELGHPDAFYSAVDHHYSYTGALITYETMLERINADTSLGLDILREGDGLELSVLPHHYLGSHNRVVYDLWPSDETISICTPTVAIPFTRFDNGKQVDSTVFALPASEEDSIHYTVYMGGDIPETVIRTDRPELPDALIFGESFTNAVETVLWTAFDETRCLDLRYYSEKSLEEYIATYQPDVVICLRTDSSYLLSFD